ncbi:MAG: citrate transporter, partial [Firmicutes bacterium]|nr:citrate transporter [Bacillota bacterium]
MITAVTIIFLLALIFFIVRGKLLPGTVLAILPIIAALVIGTGFTETLTMAHEGMLGTATVVCVYIFAAIYFSIMSDAGLFDPIIKLLLKSKRFGKTIFSVVCAGAVIAMLSHMDGSGVTTLMITVPPMLIVFDKLKIRRTTLGAIFVLVTGTMNLLPWGGPVTRAATVINMDLMELYWKIFPVQILGLVISFIFLYLISRKEEKEGVFEPGTVDVSMEISEAEQALRRPKLFWFNLGLTVLILITLFVGLPPHLAFLIGNAIALPVNYKPVK